MNRISVAEASRDFSNVLRRVTGHGESLELEESSRVVAWLTPPETPRECSIADLKHLLSSLPLPSLGEDLDEFAHDLESAKTTLAPEASRWD